ncbi:MAG: thioesterase family protein [Ardenticatenaceae bacterium]|nr:thioesterase family protein [Ardenticatenaceae bacterium]
MIPTLTQLEQLHSFNRVTIGAEHLDVMGHMNVRHYLAIFDEAAWRFFGTFGMDEAYYTGGVGGGFALQQSIRYLAECRVGDVVNVRGRMIGRSAKRIHFMLFMVNETNGTLAATSETLGAHADMRVRRTSPYPPHIAAQIDALIAESEKLDWAAPVCGAIRP